MQGGHPKCHKRIADRGTGGSELTHFLCRSQCVVPTSVSCPRSGKRPATGRALALPRHRVPADAGAKEGVEYDRQRRPATTFMLGRLADRGGVTSAPSWEPPPA